MSNPLDSLNEVTPLDVSSFVTVLSTFVDSIHDNARQIDSWTAPKSGPTNAEILSAARASTDPEIVAAVKSYDETYAAFTAARGVLGMSSSDERQGNPYLAEQTKMIEAVRSTIATLVKVFQVPVSWADEFDASLPFVKADGESRSIMTKTFRDSLTS